LVDRLAAPKVHRVQYVWFWIRTAWVFTAMPSTSSFALAASSDSTGCAAIRCAPSTTASGESDAEATTH